MGLVFYPRKLPAREEDFCVWSILTVRGESSAEDCVASSWRACSAVDQAVSCFVFKEGGNKDSSAAVRDNMQVWLPLDIQLTVAWETSLTVIPVRRCPSANCRPSPAALRGSIFLCVCIHSLAYFHVSFRPVRELTDWLIDPCPVVWQHVHSCFLEHRLISDEDEYVKSFNQGLVDVCYAWSSGSSFADICRLTEVFEGPFLNPPYLLSLLLVMWCDLMLHRQYHPISAALGGTAAADG